MDNSKIKINEYITAFAINFILVCSLFFKPLMSPQNILNFSDVIHVWYFFKYFMVSVYNNYGQIPLWNPIIYSGAPFIGNPQTTLFYPLFQIFFHVPVHYAITLVFALHFIAGGFGMFVFVRKKGVSFQASLFASILFCLNWQIISHAFAGHMTLLCSYSYIPWFFLSLDCLIKNKSLLSAVLLSVCLCFCFLCCSPQIFYYKFTAGSAYLVFMSFFYERKSFFKISVLFLLSLIFFLALSAVFILPAAELSGFFHRQGGTAYSFAASFSLKFQELITLIYPYFYCTPKPGQNMDNLFYWETAVYLGIIPLLLSIISYNSGKKQLFAFFGALGLFSLLFSMGSNGLLFKIMYYIFPGVKYFRCPARIFLLGEFSCAVLSALAMDYLFLNAKSKEISSLYKTIFILSGILLLINEIVFYSNGALISGHIKSLFILIIFGIALFLYNKGLLKTTVLAGVIFFLTLYDLLSMAYPLITSIPLKDIIKPKDVYNKILSDKSIFRVFDTVGALPQYMASYYNIQLINGDEPVILNGYLNYIRQMYRTKPTPNIKNDTIDNFPLPDIRKKFDWQKLDFLNVKYIFTTEFLNEPYLEQVDVFNLDEIYSTYFYGAYPVLPKIPGILRPKTYLYKNNNALPRAFLLKINADNDTAESLLNALPANNRAQVIPADIKEYQPDKITLNTNLKAGSFLITSEIAYPGWIAEIDGKKINIINIKNVFRGLKIPDGNHVITFIYKPQSYILGKKITLSAIVFTCLYFCGLLLTRLQKRFRRNI